MFQKYLKDHFIINCMITLIKIFFSNFNMVFVKASAHNTHFLLCQKKMKITCNRKAFCAAVLTDLSKAIDCVCHDLLIAKLNAYGLGGPPLKVVVVRGYQEFLSTATSHLNITFVEFVAKLARNQPCIVQDFQIHFWREKAFII